MITMTNSAFRIVALSAALGAASCARPNATPVPRQSQSTLPRTAPPRLTSADVGEARAALERIYATHFAHGQQTDEQAASQWYTSQLGQLMREDAEGGAAQCGVGFLNFDPLTSAQDSVASYAVGTPRAVGDTVLIPVRIHGYADERMTVAVVREAGGWRIANFLHEDWDMVSSLRRSVAELRAAPKADCSAPSGAPDSVHRDTTAAPALGAHSIS